MASKGDSSSIAAAARNAYFAADGPSSSLATMGMPPRSFLMRNSIAPPSSNYDDEIEELRYNHHHQHHQQKVSSSATATKTPSQDVDNSHNGKCSVVSAWCSTRRYKLELAILILVIVAFALLIPVLKNVSSDATTSTSAVSVTTPPAYNASNQTAHETVAAS